MGCLGCGIEHIKDPLPFFNNNNDPSAGFPLSSKIVSLS